MSAGTYKVGAHFKALNEPDLMAPSKFLEKFFSISSLSAGLCKRFLKTFEISHFFLLLGKVLLLCRDGRYHPEFCRELVPLIITLWLYMYM